MDKKWLMFLEDLPRLIVILNFEWFKARRDLTGFDVTCFSPGQAVNSGEVRGLKTYTVTCQLAAGITLFCWLFWSSLAGTKICKHS